MRPALHANARVLSLVNACNAWEGYQVAFNGTKGRIEHQLVGHATFAGATSSDEAADDIVRTRLIPLRGVAQELEPWTGSGDPGGGDEVMLNEVFGTAAPDKYKRVADERSGAYSILIGAAANRCFQTGPVSSHSRPGQRSYTA